MSEEKKRTELEVDDLDMVAGGRYSREEWLAMSPEERAAAQARSTNARRLGNPCELD